MLPRNKIKAMLMDRDISRDEIARRSGRSRHTVNVVINQHAHSRHIQQVIAEMLDMPYEKLWGDRSKDPLSHPRESIRENNRNVNV